MIGRSIRPLVVWIILLLLGSSWALAIGRYGGPDEPAHTVRAAAVARGELVGSPAADLEPGYRMVQVPRSIASGDPACYRHDPQRDASCAVASDDRAPVAAATAAGTFPPTYYAAVGALARLIGLGDDALGHRLAAVVLVSLALAGAHLRLARWPDPARAALLWATITPAAWFLTGVVNTNGLEIALFVVAWVLVAELLGAAPVGDPTRHVVALGWLGAAVIMIRPVAGTGVITVAATLAAGLVGTRRVPGRTGAEQRATEQRGPMRVGPVQQAGVLVLGAAILVAGWSFAVGLQVRDARTAEEVGAGAAVLRATAGVVDTGLEAVASLGWAEFSAPWPAVLAWAGAAALSLWAVVRGADRRLRRATAAWATALVVVPVLFEIATATRIGFVWQGRYSIGSLLGVGALGAAALGQTHRRSVLAVCALAPLASTLTLWAATRRYVDGIDGSWWFDDGGWWPPIGPWLPLVVHAASAAVLCAMLLRRGGDAGRAPLTSADTPVQVG